MLYSVITTFNSLNVYILRYIIYITKIIETNINNIFAITRDDKVFHFNGVRWKLIYSVPAILNDIHVTDDLVLIVGSGAFSSSVIKINNI